MATRLIQMGGEFSTGRNTFLDTLFADYAVTGLTTPHFYNLPLDEPHRLMLLTLPPDTGHLSFLETVDDALQRESGCIIMMDSTLRGSINDAFNIAMYVKWRCPQMPIVLTANKQDLQRAFSTEKIRDLARAFPLPDEIPILPCIATQAESVRAVVLELLKRMPQDDITKTIAAKIATLPVPTKSNLPPRMHELNFLVAGYLKTERNPVIRQISDFFDEKRHYSFDPGEQDKHIWITSGKLRLHLFAGPYGTTYNMLQDGKLRLDGIVLVVDYARVESIPMIQAHLRIAEEDDLPCILVASQPGTFSVEEVRARLQIPGNIPVLPYAATDPGVAKMVLLTLLLKMPQDEIIEKAIAKLTVL